MLRALDSELKVQVTLGHFSIILSGHSFVNLNVTFNHSLLNVFELDMYLIFPDSVTLQNLGKEKILTLTSNEWHLCKRQLESKRKI